MGLQAKDKKTAIVHRYVYRVEFNMPFMSGRQISIFLAVHFLYTQHVFYLSITSLYVLEALLGLSSSYSSSRVFDLKGYMVCHIRKCEMVN